MSTNVKPLGPKTKIGETVHVVVNDCFEGDVKLLRKKPHKYYVKIIYAVKCYSNQRDIPEGQKMWIHEDLIFRIKPVKFSERFRRLFESTKY